MNRSYITLFFLLCLGLMQSQAQHAFFPEQGIITYDKTIHVKNLLKRQLTLIPEGDMQRGFLENMIPKAPETAVLQRTLNFTPTEVSVEPVPKNHEPFIAQLMQFGMLDYGTKFYQNFAKNESQVSLEFGGSAIMIKDSLPSVKWKITNEYRNIAGYDCRRANGLTQDSVYVVAFYTDQIPTPGGPNVIQGLPGMILGLVIPEQNVNIYASKVELTAAKVNTDLLKKKGEVASREDTRKKLLGSLGRFIKEKQFHYLFTAMFL